MARNDKTAQSPANGIRDPTGRYVSARGHVRLYHRTPNGAAIIRNGFLDGEGSYGFATLRLRGRFFPTNLSLCDQSGPMRAVVGHLIHVARRLSPVQQVAIEYGESV